MIVKQKVPKQNQVKRQSCLQQSNTRYSLLQTQPVHGSKCAGLYKAKDQLSDQIVTIKVFPEGISPKEGKNWYSGQQMAIIRELKHPSLANQLDLYFQDNRWHLVHEYCGQGSLATRIQERKQLPSSSVENYIISLFKGLNYLEKHGIVHKDLKPSNVLLSDGNAKITGFGFQNQLKKSFNDSKEESLLYMSPQRFILQQNEPRSVVWSFGVIAYELLHGKHPFPVCKDESEQVFVLMKQLDKSIFSPSVSDQLKEVILRCLAVDVQKRPNFCDLRKFKYFQDYFQKEEGQKRKEKKFYSQFQIWVTQQNYPEVQSHGFKQAQSCELDRIKERTSFGDLLNAQSQSSEWANLPSATSLQQQLRQEGPLTILSMDEECLTTQLHPKLSSMPELKCGQTQPQNLFAGELDQQQVVKLIHYCRLIYKTIQLIRKLQIKEERQLIVMQSWLFQLLESLLAKTQECRQRGKSGQIQKLVCVIEGYLSKYQPEFQNLSGYLTNNVPTAYKKISAYFQTIKEKLLAQLGATPEKHKLVLSHYMVIICHITQLLWQSFIRKDYTSLNRVHDLQHDIKISTYPRNVRSLQNLIRSYTF